MQICSVPNRTYASLDLGNEKLMKIKNENEIVGILGKSFDGLLISRKHLRKCKLIGEGNLGERLPNGTYTENLGFLQSGKALIYLKPELPLADEEFIDYGIPVHTGKFLVPQDVTEDLDTDEINNMLGNFNFGLTLTLTFFLGVFISFFLAILFQDLSNSRTVEMSFRRSRRIFLRNFLTNHWKTRAFNGLAVFLLFFNLHLWFLRLMAQNNVVVNSSMLILSQEDALRSTRAACFLEGLSEMAVASTFPKCNIIRRLYEEKSFIDEPIPNSLLNKKGERCIVKKVLENAAIKTSKIFFVMEELTVYAALSLLQGSKQNIISFMGTSPIYETSYHIPFRNDKKLANEMNRMLSDSLEFGIVMRTIEKIKETATWFFQANTVYRTLDEFVDGRNKFEKLTLENFEQFFKIYFIILTLILVSFIVHHIWHFVVTKIQELAFYYFIRYFQEILQ